MTHSTTRAKEYRDFTAEQYRAMRCTSYTGGASWLRSNSERGFYVVACTPVEILRYFDGHPESTVRGEFIADRVESEDSMERGRR